MVPIIKNLINQKDKFQSLVCVTAQHREMLDQVLGLFDIKPDFDLNLMLDNQSLTHTTVNVLMRLGKLLDKERPDWILVHGDTTTAMAASLAAFYRRIRIGHVESGLRTWDRFQPYPEEVNRRVADIVADLHFAPTERAKANLMQEGIVKESIYVTGNTVIDALLMMEKKPCPKKIKVILKKIGIRNKTNKQRSLQNKIEKKLILVTAHRRENFGKPLENICEALKKIVCIYPEAQIVYPVHPNRNVQDTVNRILQGVKNITLVPPLDYLSFVHLMKRSYMILTDSGGLQEEAPSFGVPVLVLRDITERPEAVEAGTARIVGTDHETIQEETVKLLKNHKERERMVLAKNPYGDGRASEKIIAAIVDYDLV